jgi:hypothetical protein
MSQQLVEKLVSSFDELERSIEVTRESMAQKPGVPADVLSRLDQYSEIVRKQRKVAADLTAAIEAGKWDEVSRAVKLINGLSSMIRDDAQQILVSAQAGILGNTPRPDERLLC